MTQKFCEYLASMHAWRTLESHHKLPTLGGHVVFNFNLGRLNL